MTETGYLTSGQTPSQQKIALIDRFVQNSIDICTGGHLGYLFAQFTSQKMVNFRKADKENEHAIILHAGKKIASFE